MTKRVFVSMLVAAATVMLFGSQALAGMAVYQGNTTGFADFMAATGNAPVTISFDTITPGTDIGSSTINGVQFIQTGAPLIVVKGNDTYTTGGFWGAPNPESNKLFPTTGQNVLSPGGLALVPGPDANQNDSVEFVFSTPLDYFGFDHLSQSADGWSYTSYQVFDQNGLALAGGIPISGSGGGGDPAAADFWGVVATGGSKITRILVWEDDGDATFPDCNIGFDSIRHGPIASVPEPSTLGLLLLGGAAAFSRRSWKR